MKIVISTTSKFKSEILSKVHIKHSMMESNFDEDSITDKNVYEYVKKLAYGKANSIKDKVKDSIIIGLDTVVLVGNKILEKPKDLNEARNHIVLCKNNETSVITGICIINTKTGEVINDYAETFVTLRDVNDVDIDYYLENEPDILYVSGFVVETIMSNFIEKIDGSFYNILGIPVEVIYKHINDMGYNLKDLEG